MILGAVGDNFGAGMTGGMAYVYDPEGVFPARANMDTLVVIRIGSAHWEAELKGLVEEHVAQTGSPRARGILAHWEEELGHFWQICPKEMLSRLSHPLSDAAAEATAGAPRRSPARPRACRALTAQAGPWRGPGGRAGLSRRRYRPRA